MGSFEVWSGEMKLENHSYYTKKGLNIQWGTSVMDNVWTIWQPARQSQPRQQIILDISRTALSARKYFIETGKID
jgi:hypothetical protein